MATKGKPESKGAALLKAVERIVESPEKLRKRVEKVSKDIREGLPAGAPADKVRSAIETQLIATYSNRTALAGGAAALPAMFPGIGSLAAVLGGGLADMTLCLKYEVELVLSLAALRGYDIEDPRERQLAYLLAAAHTYEASSGKSALLDLIKTEVDAVWNYSPRQLGKLVGTLFVRLALTLAGKGLFRAIPVVGVVVSGATNKTLTMRVGRAVLKAFDGRPAPVAAPRRPAARKPASGRRAPARRARRA